MAIRKFSPIFDPTANTKENHNNIAYGSYNILSALLRYVIKSSAYKINKYYKNLPGELVRIFPDLCSQMKNVCTVFFDFHTKYRGTILEEALEKFKYGKAFKFVSVFDKEYYLNTLWFHYYDSDIEAKIIDHPRYPVIDIILNTLCRRLTDIILYVKNASNSRTSNVNFAIEIFSTATDFFENALVKFQKYHYDNGTSDIAMTYVEKIYHHKNNPSPSYNRSYSTSDEKKPYAVRSNYPENMNLSEKKPHAVRSNYSENMNLADIPFAGCFDRTVQKSAVDLRYAIPKEKIDNDTKCLELDLNICYTHDTNTAYLALEKDTTDALLMSVPVSTQASIESNFKIMSIYVIEQDKLIKKHIFLSHEIISNIENDKAGKYDSIFVSNGVVCENGTDISFEKILIDKISLDMIKQSSPGKYGLYLIPRITIQNKQITYHAVTIENHLYDKIKNLDPLHKRSTDVIVPIALMNKTELKLYNTLISSELFRDIKTNPPGSFPLCSKLIMTANKNGGTYTVAQTAALIQYPINVCLKQIDMMISFDPLQTKNVIMDEKTYSIIYAQTKIGIKS